MLQWSLVLVIMVHSTTFVLGRAPSGIALYERTLLDAINRTGVPVAQPSGELVIHVLGATDEAEAVLRPGRLSRQGRRLHLVLVGPRLTGARTRRYKGVAITRVQGMYLPHTLTQALQGTGARHPHLAIAFNTDAYTCPWQRAIRTLLLAQVPIVLTFFALHEGRAMELMLANTTSYGQAQLARCDQYVHSEMQNTPFYSALLKADQALKEGSSTKAPYGVQEAPSGAQEAPLGVQEAPLGVHEAKLSVQGSLLGVQEAPLGVQILWTTHSNPTAAHRSHAAWWNRRNTVWLAFRGVPIGHAIGVPHVDSWIQGKDGSGVPDLPKPVSPPGHAQDEV